jgi:hypothetical protein
LLLEFKEIKYGIVLLEKRNSHPIVDRKISNVKKKNSSQFIEFYISKDRSGRNQWREKKQLKFCH